MKFNPNPKKSRQARRKRPKYASVLRVVCDEVVKHSQAGVKYIHYKPRIAKVDLNQ